MDFTDKRRAGIASVAETRCLPEAVPVARSRYFIFREMRPKFQANFTVRRREAAS